MRRIESALLVLLQILVVGKGKALHGHEQLREVAIHAAALAADKLGKIGVLFLRHNGRARGIAIRKRDETKFGRRPQDDLFGQA